MLTAFLSKPVLAWRRSGCPTVPAFRAHWRSSQSPLLIMTAPIWKKFFGSTAISSLPRSLKSLRSLTTKYGAVLIFDEVMTGFRVAYGGAQQLYGIVPDLTTLGKIIGGGLPVGAYGGKAELMDLVAPAGPVYQAGTLSGNPLAVAAGLKTLEVICRPGFYERLEVLSA